MPRERSVIAWETCEAWTADHAHVSERETFTGIYDANGTPLHRPQQAIGFDPHRWDSKPQPPKMRISHGGRSMGGREHPEGAPCKTCDRKGKR